MSVGDYKDLKRKVKDLCVFVHTEISNEEVSDSQESLSELLRLSPEEMIDYVKILVSSLLKKKPEEVDSSGFKGYQKALQKLEAEVRNHINVRNR